MDTGWPVVPPPPRPEPLVAPSDATMRLTAPAPEADPDVEASAPTPRPTTEPVAPPDGAVAPEEPTRILRADPAGGPARRRSVLTPRWHAGGGPRGGPVARA